MRKRTSLLLAVAAVALAAAAPAQAFKPCTTTEHCYAITSWYMTNGESVLGSSIQVDTISLALAAPGDYLTNEQWAGFDGGAHWIEAGQQGVWGQPLLYFWAVYNHYGFQHNEDFCCVAEQAWNTYLLQYDNGRLAQHAWDAYVNGSLVGIGEGLELEAHELEAGLETTDPRNTNTGETAYAEAMGREGRWWKGWEASGAGNYAQPQQVNYIGEHWSGGCSYNLFSQGLRGDIYFADNPCGHAAALLPIAEPSGAAPAARAIPEGGTTVATAQVVQAARERSAQDGDANPTSITLVPAPRGRALALALPGTQPLPSERSGDTVVVQMRGTYTVSLAPPGRPAPAGSYLDVVVDAHSGAVIAEHIGDAALALGTLGRTEAVQ